MRGVFSIYFVNFCHWLASSALIDQESVMVIKYVLMPSF